MCEMFKELPVDADYFAQVEPEDCGLLCTKLCHLMCLVAVSSQRKMSLHSWYGYLLCKRVLTPDKNAGQTEPSQLHIQTDFHLPIRPSESTMASQNCASHRASDERR